VPVEFTPTYSVHKDKLCHGVYILLTDAIVATWWTSESSSPGPCAVFTRMISGRQNLSFAPAPADAGRDQADRRLKDIRAGWQSDLDDFQKRRAKY